MFSKKPSARTPVQSYRRYQRLLKWMRFKQNAKQALHVYGVYALGFSFITGVCLTASWAMTRDAFNRGQVDGMSRTLRTLSPHLCVPSDTNDETDDVRTRSRETV